jgi:lipoprotein NlpD
MFDMLRPARKWALVALAAALLAGCGAPPRRMAPVEDRTATPPPVVVQPAVVAETPAPPAPPPLPGAENAGKPGYYTVRPGDTLIRIALESGQNWRDIVRWNALENPNLIEVGQVLRISPPVPLAPAPSDGVVARPVVPGAVTPAVPLPGPTASVPRSTSTVPAPAPAAPPAAPPAPAPAAPPAPSVPGEDDIAWAWPTPGNATVLAGFDEAKNKGLDIAGNAGDPVLASADGRVVYAGAGLRGYGNLIILKHNNTFLTAYAHNQTLLVKEDQSVRKGQKIAEMGSTDSDRVKLHFEIRRQGKPVDPARYLPQR